jgi:hypothetical protein
MADFFDDHYVKKAYLIACADVVRAIEDKACLEVVAVRMAEAENVVRISINTKRMM